MLVLVLKLSPGRCLCHFAFYSDIHGRQNSAWRCTIPTPVSRGHKIQHLQVSVMYQHSDACALVNVDQHSRSWQASFSRHWLTHAKECVPTAGPQWGSLVAGV